MFTNWHSHELADSPGFPCVMEFHVCLMRLILCQPLTLSSTGMSIKLQSGRPKTIMTIWYTLHAHT